MACPRVNLLYLLTYYYYYYYVILNLKIITKNEMFVEYFAVCPQKHYNDRFNGKLCDKCLTRVKVTIKHAQKVQSMRRGIVKLFL